MVQILHDRACQKQHLSPFFNKNHLPLDVQSLVQVVQVLQLEHFAGLLVAVASTA